VSHTVCNLRMCAWWINSIYDCSKRTNTQGMVITRGGSQPSGKGCFLPTNDDNTGLVLAHISSGPEALAQKVPRAEVVAAFNSVPSEVLFSIFEAWGNATQPSPVLVYCGDTQIGKRLAASQ